MSSARMSSAAVGLALCLSFYVSAGQGSNSTDVAALRARLDDLVAQVAANEALSQARENAAWLVISGITILGMQFGFALLEVGCTAPPAAAGIMMNNLVDFAAGALGCVGNACSAQCRVDDPPSHPFLPPPAPYPPPHPTPRPPLMQIRRHRLRICIRARLRGPGGAGCWHWELFSRGASGP